MLEPKRPNKVRRTARNQSATYGDYLEQIPERLVVNGMMELYFRAFNDGSQLAGQRFAAACFQVRVTALHIGAENLADPVQTTLKSSMAC